MGPAVVIIVASGAALAVQASTTDERLQAFAGIAVLAVIALLALGSVLRELVSHIQATALEVAARRGQVQRLPLAIASDATGQGEATR
ncbi:hypothetical protein E3G68_004284 [Mycobacteroides abscessus]|nr:hypothetical protein [Mycobacteroides abscessus]SHX08940.1 Uncharacterised protein [Mycobacteroides abscessus subsp. abscessus]SHY19773.1 Uncharacterised protein [Mycobacteroides abscessus subsp. abscessus]